MSTTLVECPSCYRTISNNRTVAVGSATWWQGRGWWVTVWIWLILQETLLSVNYYAAAFLSLRLNGSQVHFQKQKQSFLFEWVLHLHIHIQQWNFQGHGDVFSFNFFNHRMAGRPWIVLTFESPGLKLRFIAQRASFLYLCLYFYISFLFVEIKPVNLCFERKTEEFSSASVPHRWEFTAGNSIDWDCCCTVILARNCRHLSADVQKKALLLILGRLRVLPQSSSRAPISTWRAQPSPAERSSAAEIENVFTVRLSACFTPYTPPGHTYPNKNQHFNG